MPLEDAHREVIWPGYRTAIERIRDDLIRSRTGDLVRAGTWKVSE